MPFRNDEDARLARLASLQNENEDLRAQLAEQQRKLESLEASPTPEPVKPPASPSRPRWGGRGVAARTVRRALDRVWELALGAAIVIAALAVFIARDRGERVVTELAVFEGTLTVRAERTVFGRRSITTPELFTFDLATGRRRAKLEVSSSGSLTIPHHGERAWVQPAQGELALIDFHTLETVVAHGQLVARFPELADGFRIDPSRTEIQISDGSVAEHGRRRTAAVALILADGSRAWLDTEPRLVRATPFEPWWGPIGYACLYYDAPSCEQQKRCFTWLGDEHSETRHLAWSPGRREADEPPTSAGPDAARLHAPAFVKRFDRRCALEIDGGVLVRHESSAVEPKHRLMSLLAGDGTVRWSRRVDELLGGDAMPIGALLGGERIYVLLGDRWRESVSLRKLRTTRLVLVHLAADSGETLATYPLL